MTKKDITKKIVSTVAGYGAGVITYAIIRNNIPADLPLHKKAGVVVGAFMVAGVVSDAATGYSDRLIDDLADAISSAKSDLTN